MKAEKKTVAFMFFSVFLQFVYSLGKKQKHKKNRIWAGGGGGMERDKSRRTGGPNSCGG